MVVSSFWLAALAACLLLLFLASLSNSFGCSASQATTPDNGVHAPAVELLFVQGSGAIGVRIYGQNLEAEWQENGVQGDSGVVHCSVVSKLLFNGFSLGSGYVPGPVSNSECSGLFPPFRLGAPPIESGSGPGELDQGSGRPRQSPSTDSAEGAPGAPEPVGEPPSE